MKAHLVLSALVHRESKKIFRHATQRSPLQRQPYVGILRPSVFLQFFSPDNHYDDGVVVVSSSSSSSANRTLYATSDDEPELYLNKTDPSVVITHLLLQPLPPQHKAEPMVDPVQEGLFIGLSPMVWLNVVAILWGSQHAIIKTIMEDGGNPVDLLLLRFGLASILAISPKLWRKDYEYHHTDDDGNNVKSALEEDDTTTTTTRKENHSRTAIFQSHQGTALRWGVELGIYLFLGFLFQAVGLQFTTAQKSGFLLYLNVKFVPFLAWIFYQRSISIFTMTSALAAFVGTTLLATQHDGSITSSSSSSWNIGDLWTIAAAAASAMFILRLEQASRAPVSAMDLNAISLIVVTVLSALGTMLVPSDQNTTSSTTIMDMASKHPWELLYLGGVTTALSNWIQTRAQRFVPAERAALIYSLDPVYGAGFAYLLLGEQLTSPAAVFGASLITVAAGTNAYLEFNKKERG